ncbi:acriflavine resistance protein B [Alkalispirochaeta sphaeroplastigenens]|uniref:Acriflavine resistance protein B n=2 Tax=Alkalispirochaeta sphaeroplastigenens TaxID=1187066 RepID=A0A2S4JN51_9SPIO|nr:acriflavine resistance protein B [Alkalispirochaeta sphaeroplastigenens]
MNMTRLSFEKNRFTVAILLCLSVAGVIAYIQSPKAEDPGFTVRTAVVVTYYPGASPQRIEQLISKPLEESIQEIPEVERVRSQSRTGVSIIYIDVSERYTDMPPIWDEVRISVENTRRSLPEQIIGPIVNDRFGDVFGTIVTVSGEGVSYEELEEIAKELRERVIATDQVASVSLHGVQDRRVYVDYSDERLAELGITPYQLRELIRAQNIVLPGGEVFTEWERIILGPTGNFESLEELKNLLIPLPARGEVVFLQDIAHVHMGYREPAQTHVHTTGKPAVAVGISLRDGGNINILGDDVKEVVARYQQELPVGINLDFVAIQADHVRDRVNNFGINLIQAMVTIMAVMLISIGFRMGMVVTSLVPVTMLTTFFVFLLFGIGIDQVSLASLIIALGMLVDNSIVIAESTMVLSAGGLSPRDAAIRSAKELGSPLLISSLIVCAAFLPALLAEHSLSEYASPVFWGVTITLLLSWVFALTMTPMMAARYLKAQPEGGAEEFDTPFQRWYAGVLHFFLHHRVMIIVILTVSLVGSFYAFRLVERQFFPNNDRAVITVEMEYAAGTRLERTRDLVEEIEAFYGGPLQDSVKSWHSYIGGDAPRFYLPFTPEPPRSEYAVMVVNLTHQRHIPEVIDQTNAYLEKHHPEVRVRARPLVQGPPVDAAVEVRVSGSDPDRIFEYADRVRDRMRSIEGIYGVRDDWGPWTKQLAVDIDEARAKAAGITSQEVAVSLQTALTGLQVSEYRGADEVIPITLRSNLAPEGHVSKLETVSVYSSTTGRSVPLQQIANLNLEWTPSRIMRRDLARTVTIQADAYEGFNAIAIANDLDEWLAEESTRWAGGYHYEIAGEADATTEANKAIFDKLMISALIMLLLLILQFNSLRKTFIILLTIPFGLIGVVFGLIVTRSIFGVMTLLGVISLAGIVIKNAVVLLDRIKIEIDENGLEPYQAIVTASQRRIRPILLTTLTTIFGLLPLWFGGSPLWESMTIAIIFGLIFSTILTLGFVPAMYSLLFKVDIPPLPGKKKRA